jgi:hypothetical protein
MAELSTTAATAVLTGATSAAAAAGRPPQEVIVWALMGSLVAVWLDRQKGEPLTVGWAARAVGMIFVSVLTGIAGSAGAPALSDYALLGFLSKLDRWVLAFTIAALIHKAGPLAYRVTLGRVRQQEGTDAAARP